MVGWRELSIEMSEEVDVLSDAVGNKIGMVYERN